RQRLWQCMKAPAISPLGGRLTPEIGMSDEHDEKLGLEALRPAPDQVGLSLDQLSQAFANMLGQGAEPYSLPEDPDADGLDAAAHAILAGSDTSDRKPEAKSPVDAQCEISPR